MLKEFKLPDLGEGIHEGEVVEILVAVGDRVEDGQTIMIVETDKATTEIPAPVTGTVKEIRVKPGEVVKVGEVMLTFETEAAAAPPKAERKPSPAAPEKPLRKEAEEQKPASLGFVPAPAPAPAPIPAPVAAPTPEQSEGPVPAAPSTRRLARELGVDLHDVPPTGSGGRVTSEDVAAFAERRKAPKPVEVAAPEPAPSPPSPEEAPPAAEFPSAAPSPLAVRELTFDGFGPVERLPLRSVRRATARHMARAWAEIPHVSHADVADITEIEAFRRKHKAEVEAQGGSLSMTVFVIKAVVAALKAFPRFNSSLDMDAEEITLKRYYHLGVATDTDKGLIVPVIRDADRKSLTQLAVELRQLAERTRNGKAGRDDMVGGTLTITNIGPLGGTGFTPIVNHPQVAILGLAQARLQPVIEGDLEHYKVAARLMLPLVLGFDHRVVDGADAARFMNMIIESLEKPEKLMLVM